jgi:protein-S-isoprenylcysteine O-methyltransferase Ste14
MAAQRMPMPNNLVSFVRERYQRIISLYLFVVFLGYAVYQAHQLIKAGRLDFIEISFLVQNIVLAMVVGMRKSHVSIDRNLFHQVVALAAFFSGAAFMGQPPSGGETARLASTLLIVASNLLGIVTLLGLGRSFGILIALREVRSTGIYSVVRHPMYVTDILLRVGFLVSHFNPFTAVMAVFSIGCYAYRAVLEERHLSTDEKYREYMARTRYRFIPYLF